MERRHWRRFGSKSKDGKCDIRCVPNIGYIGFLLLLHSPPSDFCCLRTLLGAEFLPRLSILTLCSLSLTNDNKIA